MPAPETYDRASSDRKPESAAAKPHAPDAPGREILRAVWRRVLALLSVWAQRPVAIRTPSAEADTGPTLNDKIVQRESLTAILLTIPSAGIAVLTYYGVSLPLTETGSTIVQKGQAVGFALTLGVFAWLAWFYLFGLIYRLTGERLRHALVAGCAMVVSIAVIDAPFNMLALAGGPAAQMSLVDMARVYEMRRDAMIARVTVTRRLIPAIRVQAARFASLQAEEVKSGTFSGRNTPGKVSASFGQIALLLNGLADQLDAGLGKTASLQNALTATLGHLKETTYRPGPIRERMEAASVAGDQIDALLSQAGQYDFAASIDATLATLDTSLPRPQPGGDAFARTQAAEITSIAAMVKPVADVLRAGLATIRSGSDETSATPPRPESPLTAIRTYWRPLLPHWIAALFIDLAPAALLIVLIAAYREAERAEADARASSNLKP